MEEKWTPCSQKNNRAPAGPPRVCSEYSFHTLDVSEIRTGQMLGMIWSARGADFMSMMGFQEEKCKFIHPGTPTGRGTVVFWRTVTPLEVDKQEDRPQIE